VHKSGHLSTAPYKETRTATVYNQSDVLTSISSKQGSAISGYPLSEWAEQTDFISCSLQLDRPAYAPASCTMAFTPQCLLLRQQLTIF